jgi:hypothetical protein
MADIVTVYHGMEKFELTWCGDFFGMTQFICELPVFDLELLERFKLADIEISSGPGSFVSLAQLPDFPREFETAAGRPLTN